MNVLQAPKKIRKLSLKSIVTNETNDIEVPTEQILVNQYEIQPNDFTDPRIKSTLYKR